MDWAEGFGYAASVLIAGSILLRSIVRLRLVNMTGAAFFIVYGVALASIPIIATNVVVVAAHAVHLFRMRRRGDAFDILEVHSQESAFYSRFLAHYREDIAEFFPAFDPEAVRNPIVLFILADMRPAGLFVCEPEGDALHVHLDYVIPEFRDMRVGRYLYSTWRPSGNYREMVARTDNPGHVRYLKRMGFVPDPDRGAGWYVRSIAAEMPTLESAVELPVAARDE